jgi:hypothetical protein
MPAHMRENKKEKELHFALWSARIFCSSTELRRRVAYRPRHYYSDAVGLTFSSLRTLPERVIVLAMRRGTITTGAYLYM